MALVRGVDVGELESPLDILVRPDQVPSLDSNIAFTQIKLRNGLSDIFGETVVVGWVVVTVICRCSNETEGRQFQNAWKSSGVQHCLVEGPVVHVEGEPRDAAVVVRLGLPAQSNVLARSAVQCSAAQWVTTLVQWV